MSRWSGPGWPSGIPVVNLDYSGAADAVVDTWLHGVNDLIGLPMDQRQATYRQRLAHRAHELVSRLQIVLPMSIKTCVSIVAYAIARGGMDDESVREAVVSAIKGELEFLDHEARQAVLDLIHHDAATGLAAIQKLIANGELAVAARLAHHLDGRGKTGGRESRALRVLVTSQMQSRLGPRFERFSLLMALGLKTVLVILVT